MERVCPRCGMTYCAVPAISRIDNETEICPKCGIIESLVAFGFDVDEAKKMTDEIETYYKQ